MFTIATVLWTFVTVLSLFADIASSDCSISINHDFGEPPPLLIENTTGKPAFAFPASNSNAISVKEGSSIEVYCAQAIIHVNGTSTNENVLSIYCQHGRFNLRGTLIFFNTISCSESIKADAQYTSKRRFNQCDEFEIGYPYKNDFLSIIKGCFNKTYQITLYTASEIPNTSASVTGRDRKCWTVDVFYNGTKVIEIYNKKNQSISINKQLALPENSTEYIQHDPSGTMYLARGHLTPRTDFIYGPHQDATFFCINAVPQWQTLNAGNWKRIEQHLKDLAARTKAGLKIYTGIWETLKLNRTIGGLTELYMSIDGQQMKIPIPKYIWKIAYDEHSNAGIAFIGVNNPYARDLPDLKFCEDVCDQANVSLNRSNYTRYGYVFCCTVDALRKRVKTIPAEVPEGFKLLTGMPAKKRRKLIKKTN